jgi:hypothetical protein
MKFQSLPSDWVGPEQLREAEHIREGVLLVLL